MKNRKFVLLTSQLLLIVCAFLPRNILVAQQEEGAYRPGEIRQDRLGFEMVYVPGAAFEIGISPDRLWEVCRDRGEVDLDHCVEIIGEYTGATFVETTDIPPFWIDHYEITGEQFEEVCQIMASSVTDYYRLLGELCNNLPRPVGFTQEPQNPQVNVTWYLASAFCNYRGAHLPTDAEWEYAASGPEKLIYPWGNTIIENYTHLGVSQDASQQETYPVGTIPENRSWVGIYDMAGNAAEWTGDRFLPYVLRHATLEDLPSFYNGLETAYITRGGGAGYSSAWALTTFYREYAAPESYSSSIGFRCARSTPPGEY